MKIVAAIVVLISVVALIDCRHVQSRGKRAQENDGLSTLVDSSEHPGSYLTPVPAKHSLFNIEGIRGSETIAQESSAPNGLHLLRLHKDEDTLVRINFKIPKTRTFEKVRAFLRYSCFFALDDDKYEKRIDASEVMERFCTSVTGKEDTAYTCSASSHIKEMDLWMPKAAAGPWWLPLCPRIEVHLVLHEENKREKPILSAGFYAAVVEDAKAPSSINSGNDDPFDDW